MATILPNSTNCTGYTAWATDRTNPDTLATIIDSGEGGGTFGGAEYTSGEKNTVSTDDSNYVLRLGNNGCHLIRYRVTGTETQLDFTMKSESVGPSQTQHYMYVWNVDSADWELLDTSTSGSLDTLTGTVSASVSDYIDGSNDVHALVAAGSGAGTQLNLYYAELETTEAPSETEPDAPTGLTATADGSGTIDLSWTAPVDDGGAAITGYRIDRRSPSGEGSWNPIIADTESTDTTYSNTGLTAETNYGYIVYAINSAGLSVASSEANDTTGSIATADITGDLDLGTVIIGDYAEATATVTNNGDDTLFITSVTSPLNNTITVLDSLPSFIVAGGSETLTIRWTPVAELTLSYTFTMTSDAGEDTITFTGESELPAAIVKITSPVYRTAAEFGIKKYTYLPTTQTIYSGAAIAIVDGEVSLSDNAEAKFIGFADRDSDGVGVLIQTEGRILLPVSGSLAVGDTVYFVGENTFASTGDVVLGTVEKVDLNNHYLVYFCGFDV